MTKEEVNKIPFGFVSHMSMADLHTTTFRAEVGKHIIMYCIRTPWDEERMDVANGRRVTVHFMIDGKVYKTKKAFYEAMEEI